MFSNAKQTFNGKLTAQVIKQLSVSGMTSLHNGLEYRSYGGHHRKMFRSNQIKHSIRSGRRKMLRSSQIKRSTFAH